MKNREKFETFLNVLLIFLLGTSITFLMTLYIESVPQNIAVGAVAVKRIKADQNYEIVDEKSTEALREEAMASVLPVYDFDPTVEAALQKKISEAFQQSREGLVLAGREARKKILSEEEEEALRGAFEATLGIPLSGDATSIIRRYRFHPAVEKALISLLHEGMRQPVIGDKKELEPLANKGFVLRQLTAEGEFPEEIVNDTRKVFSLEEAVKKIETTHLGSVSRLANFEFMDSQALAKIKSVAISMIKPNLNFNGIETDLRRQKAAGNIKNTLIKIKRGEAIIRDGDRFEPWHITVLEGIRKERLKTSRVMKFLGTFGFVCLVLFIVYSFASKYIRKFKPNRKDLVFLGSCLIAFLALLRVGVFIAGTIRDALPFSVGDTTLYYVIPVAAGAMLVRFVLNSEIALVFAVILSLFSGVFLENNLEMTMYYLVSGVFAAHVIAHAEKRSSVLLCGAYSGLLNALAVLSLNLITYAPVSAGVDLSQIALNAVAGFMGGIFTATTVLVLTPVCETVFDYTTDIKLLELANMSHPLLKEMIVQSPGTYHHSQMVGILSEAAAQAIGANPLFARVASYYHDIGKIKKPQYFVENQRGENPHDKLSPSMSALIVEAHVKDGLEMAREYKLPKKIADMIPQHQGTKIMGFFYNKAKKMADPSLGKIEEKDYRYPGPKPQTREAGIIMLADTVEAGVRSLPEKTPSKIQSTVEKLVNQHFVDEQLDECDLTLKDLHRIAEAFVKILIGIYHQRVEYPEGALIGGVNVSSLPDKVFAIHDSSSTQPPSADSNVAPLFRKKAEKNPSSSGTS